VIEIGPNLAGVAFWLGLFAAIAWTVRGVGIAFFTALVADRIR
jgi:hypothetical protein